MRILFLISHFPYPPQSGGALRAYGLIKGVVAAGHQVDIVCFADNLPVESPLHRLCGQIVILPQPQRSIQKRLRDIILTRHADMGRRFWSDEALGILQKHLATHPYDIIHAESIEMAAYLPSIHAWYPHIPLIYGSLNAEADLQRTIFETERRYPKKWLGALYSWIQWRRLTRLEQDICKISAAVLAVSEADQILLQAFSDTPVVVVKNGIETADYQHIQANDTLGNGAIVFTGSMSYRPNVDAVLWFVEAILPLIAAQYPNAHLYVVGYRPHARIQALQAQANITITGKVDEIEPYWAGAKVYIAPLRMGSGTRFKILEAMAAGCAVVSTTIGAQGLGVQSGQELLLADSVEDFAHAVLAVLTDARKRAELGQHGRDFTQAHFDWAVIVPELLKAYVQVAKENKS